MGGGGGGDKMYPVVVRFLNSDCVFQTELLGVPTCSEASYDKNIYLLLEFVPYCLKYIYLKVFRLWRYKCTFAENL